MTRPLFFVLGFVTLIAAAPARGQDLLEAFVEGFVEGMNDAANDYDGGYNNYNNGHHHHHHNNNGYYYPNNNGYYYPNNNGYYPPASQRPSVVVPAVVQNSLPYKGPGVTIVLEEEEGGSVTYVIDGKESSTIQAGQQQMLTTKGKYEVRFSRGKAEDGRNFGEARYTITEGDYHFEVTDKGWELFRDKEQPRLAAAQSSTPSGIKTNALPRKSQPATKPAAAAPAASGILTLGRTLP